MESLAQRAIRKLRERHFAAVARAVVHTPPVQARDDGLIIFSMIGTRVVDPYLVAAKSLHARLGRGRFAILDDGTLTLADRAVLEHHLGQPEIRSINEVDTGSCPRGGCWERLLTLLDLRREAYVIQLDSDTVTVGPVPEVAQAIAAGRSFTLAGGPDAQLLPLAAIAQRTRAQKGAGAGRMHVQDAIEQVIDQVAIPGHANLRYVRGSAGFAGFARNPDGRALAEHFSVASAALIGPERWAEWGTEQVASNFVVANQPDPLLLPYARYMNYWGERSLGGVSFVHFVGTCRYDRGTYRRTARAAIAGLRV